MVKNVESQVERCRGCGKPVDLAAPHTRVEQVGPKARGPRPKQCWGTMHRACFARMTGRPRDLLEVLSEREATVLGSTG